MTETKTRALRLLADEPAMVDLLSFDAIAQTIADALLDDALDPVALGLSGSWGSGKTTVLNLVDNELVKRGSAENKVIIVRTAPWRYDPSVGAKETLIGEVLVSIRNELEGSADKTEKAKALLTTLAARVDWAKALKIAATTAVTLQLPNPSDLIELVRPKTAEPEDARGLDQFRSEFEQLLGSEELSHVRAVVVLVDDLDRCLPVTVVDSLEAMRLFLDVRKMSFVIAADELRVADAIRARFETTAVPPEESDDVEDPARLYLHKIVQTAFPLPALSNFDTLAYLLLLLLQSKLRGVGDLGSLIEQCAAIRRSGGGPDDLKPIADLDYHAELAFASRLTPLLHEKMHGNPRRIKRFMNDLEVRQVVAQRRGIALDPAVIAKLMVLEVVLPTEFKRLLGWFAAGEMRDRLENLERGANSPAARPSPADGNGNGDGDGVDHAEAVDDGEFSDALIRWAKLSPPIDELDLSPYLTLAASFAGVVLVDKKLPERLRDIAANLLADGRIEQASVTDADLDALGEGDLINLIEHIGRTLRDQPNRQKQGVNALLRIGRRSPGVVENIAAALRMLPGRELRVGTPLQFRKDDANAIRAVLPTWQETAIPIVARSVKSAIDGGVS